MMFGRHQLEAKAKEFLPCCTDTSWLAPPSILFSGQALCSSTSSQSFVANEQEAAVNVFDLADRLKRKCQCKLHVYLQSITGQ